MKVESHAIIKISEQSRLIFSEPVWYKSPAGIKVQILNHDKDDDTLVVIMNMETPDLDSASFETERELLRAVNFLSWKHNLVVTKYRTTGYQHSETVGQTHATVLAETLHVRASVSMLKTVGTDGAKQFSAILANEYTDDTNNILLKWRDAISQESPMARMLLMFQILEALAGSRIAADTWIRKIEPGVPLRMSGKNGNEKVSIYTYLRDCVHAKPENPRFPSNEVEAHVNNLRAILRKALKEKFPDLPGE